MKTSLKKASEESTWGKEILTMPEIVGILKESFKIHEVESCSDVSDASIGIGGNDEISLQCGSTYLTVNSWDENEASMYFGVMRNRNEFDLRKYIIPELREELSKKEQGGK